ncbi:hypothetical protein ASD11_13550 [Aeromicrobium sp. Root495]|uniref:lipase family protein n=1 Tax=Aeromicrobium sp. Root495 TaxID=1736550 RepID=UPI0006FADD72|nr:lipase family protein [Aeromicrobium sp. Root495]KQY60465.1 hypothetical protein ASD11_13550 [Aeromicrobium sp. Root495]
MIRRLVLAWCTVTALTLSVTVHPGAAATQPRAEIATSTLDDPFFTYSGDVPLSSRAPGTVLKTRTVKYHIQGIALPVTVQQILYRTRDSLGRPVANATSIIRPAVRRSGPARVISYQSAYDSLTPADQPSAVIAGGRGLGTIVVNGETAIIAPALLAGYVVNIPDTQGPRASFGAGREYGYATLDSLRALRGSGSSDVTTDSKMALLGYSGGAIATEWATELAPSYAPEVNRQLVGSAFGGVLVHPLHNLEYVQGSTLWAGVLASGLIGIARAYDIEIKTYLNDRGLAVVKRLQDKSIAYALGQYPGLRWKDLALPQYASVNEIPDVLRVGNELIMGTGGTPTVPLYIAQGTGGWMEGTRSSARYGAGDGIMVAGDVRSLARQYCAAGTKVKYEQYPLSHVGTGAAFFPKSLLWTFDRFAGRAPTSTCGRIAAGNSLAPLRATD